MQKRVVRVISYEGNAEWVDRLLRVHLPRWTLFNKQGTVKELQRIELKEGEEMRVVVERNVQR